MNPLICFMLDSLQRDLKRSSWTNLGELKEHQAWTQGRRWRREQRTAAASRRALMTKQSANGQSSHETARPINAAVRSLQAIWTSVAAAPSEINGSDLATTPSPTWRTLRRRGQPALTLTCPRLLILSHGFGSWLGVESCWASSTTPSRSCIHLSVSAPSGAVKWSGTSIDTFWLGITGRR